MKLNSGLHLGYCTNIHRGETWDETLAALQTHTLEVRKRVSPGAPYGIGLRLSAAAARALSDRATLLGFQHWLEQHNCYVFTINGFPYGQFHGTRVKEQVYRPDWTTAERLDYTNLLFNLLAELLPAEVEGSVSTVPGSFKEFRLDATAGQTIGANLLACARHIEEVSEKSGRRLHLGLEPEPCCWLETTAETIRFFDILRADHHDVSLVNEFLGVNYDTCHLAVEFEDAAAGLQELRAHGIKLSKVHLSNALSVRPTPEVRRRLAAFTDDTYLHQTIIRRADGTLKRYRDLPDALSAEPPLDAEIPSSPEWRIHFHIPLHHPPSEMFGTTTGHLLSTLDFLAANPGDCPHLEMETYTWEVLPAALKQRSVVDQLVAEYEWTLARLRERRLAE